MRKPNPGSVGKSGNDVREAARDAARREGMSMSEWLAQAVGQYAAETGIDPAYLDEEDQLEAVTARLRRLGVRGLRHGVRRPAPNWPSAERVEDKPAQSPKPRLPRVAPWSVGAMALRHENTGLAYDDADALLDQAAARFENSAEIETLAQRLDRLEAELQQRFVQEPAKSVASAGAPSEARPDSFGKSALRPPLNTPPDNAGAPSYYSDQLDRVESKVNALLSSLSSSTAMPAPGIVRPAAGRQVRLPDEVAPKRSPLAEAIAEIARHQHALEMPGARSPAQDQHLRQDQRTRYVRRRPDTVAADEADGVVLAGLRSDIASLAGKVEDMRREQAERDALPPAACNLDKLRAEIATMSDALRDLASRGSIAPLEAAIRNLTEQIESSRTDGIREAVLRPLERVVGELRHALADVDPRTTIRGLEGEVQKLGNKLDTLGKCNFDAAALGTIDDRTREIRDLLTAAPAPVERIERQVAALTERFDQMRSEPPRSHDGGLEAVADELRALMREPGPSALAKIEGQLDAISAKVEEAMIEARDESRYTALANRINDVHQELAEAIVNGAPQLDQAALENLVRGLADRIEQARGPQADNHAIEALQRQVSEFAARLDHANIGMSSLNSLEQSIGDLFSELERTREASFNAAERAARNVLQEALARVPSVAENPEVTHNIAELRKMQDEAGRRTLSTLNAVHETLEKVVDRLAVVESEVADVRTHRPPELLASGPAPNFAPAAPREPPAFAASMEAPAPRSEGRSQQLRAAAARLKEEPAADALEDFLIEPGRGFPGRRDPLGGETAERKPASAADAFDSPDATAGRAGFIAAARRAAQAAQMESAAAMGRPSARGGIAADGDGTASLVEQTRNFISQHKRPVVLSVAALFLAMGAYAVIKTAGHTPAPDVPVNGGKEAPARPLAPPRLPAPSEHSEHKVQAPFPAAVPSHAKPAPSATGAPASKAKGTVGAIPGSDPIVTGSIASSAAVAPAPAEPSPAVLQSLAQAHNAKAQYELASLYATGHGLPRDLKLAAHWYEKAAAQGLAPAQYRLGSFYEKGLGVERNLARAMSWYRKAAEAGNVRAMHNLAVLTAEGGDSGKPDYASAARWFHEAAEYGVHDSQYNLAILLARGLGVRQNLTLSYTWFAVAATQGDEDAGKKRDDVGAKLSAADLIAAKATAAAFHPKTPDPAANEVTAPEGGWVAPAAQIHRMARPRLSRL